MSIIFGSKKANEIKEKDKDIERRIARLQEEYIRKQKKLNLAYEDLEQARSDIHYWKAKIGKLEHFAKIHNIELEEPS